MLVVHHDATDVLLCLRYFKMKLGSIDDPNIYLGATLKQMHLANGVMVVAALDSPCHKQSDGHHVGEL